MKTPTVEQIDQVHRNEASLIAGSLGIVDNVPTHPVMHSAERRVILERG
jgi:hypothetical protein